MKQTFKSVGAVVAGFLTVVVLSVVTDLVMERAGIFSPPTEGLFVTWMLALALAYRTAYTVLGGYVAARLAPTNAMKHVCVLGVIGTIAGVLGVVAGWNLSQHWYPIALAVLAYPSVWVGGQISKK